MNDSYEPVLYQILWHIKSATVNEIAFICSKCLLLLKESSMEALRDCIEETIIENQNSAN